MSRFSIPITSTKHIDAIVNATFSYEIHKLITKDDHLVIIFNNSQIVTHFNEYDELVNRFRIDHPRFIKDYSKRISYAKKKGGWINCFGSVFLDETNKVHVCYFNGELDNLEIYRYRLDGKFVDTLRFKNLNDETYHKVKVKDKKGNYYGTDRISSKIIIYREVE